MRGDAELGRRVIAITKRIAKAALRASSLVGTSSIGRFAKDAARAAARAR
jgi:hypothetical protein